MLIDSHAHVNFGDFKDDLEEVLARAKEAGVEKIINIGTSLGDSQEVIELAQKYENLYATVGIHPNDDPTATVENVDWDKFEQLTKQPKVVGIGECGLDFSRSQDKERQIKLFEKQIEIAGRRDLPLSIHIREAQEELMKSKVRGRGVFHCFSGDESYLNFILEKLPDFFISFAGNLTFKNSENLRKLAKLVPANRLLVETDCPFLSPEPGRGKRNEPANVKITAAKLAEVRKSTLEELAGDTSANTERLFKI